MASEIADLRQAILNLTNSLNRGSPSSSSRSGAASGITQGIAEAGVTASLINPGKSIGHSLDAAVNKISDSLTAAVKATSTAFNEMAEHIVQASFEIADSNTLFGQLNRQVRVTTDVMSSWGYALRVYGTRLGQESQKIGGSGKERESSNRSWLSSNFNSKKALDSWTSVLNRSAVGLTAFATAGLMDTVEGVQLKYEFGRLSYEIADALLPVIKDFTNALRILGKGMHAINHSSGTGVANLFKYTLYGAVGLKGLSMLNGLTGGALGAGARGAGSWAWNGAKAGARAGWGAASPFLAEVGGGSVLGGLAVTGAVVGGLFEAVRGMYRTRQFYNDFSQMEQVKIGGQTSGWVSKNREKGGSWAMTSEGPEWRTKAQTDKPEQDVAWHWDTKHFKQEWLDRPENKKMHDDAVKKWGDHDPKEGDDGKKHLQEIMHTSFGAVDKLWEQMNAMATENPAADAQEEANGILSQIAEGIVSILQWINGVSDNGSAVHTVSDTGGLGA